MSDVQYKKLVDSFIETLNTIDGCAFWTGCGHVPISATILGMKTFERIMETGFYASPYTPRTEISVIRTANLVAIDILIYQKDPDYFFQWLSSNREIQEKKIELQKKGILYITHYDLKKIIDKVKDLNPIERDLTQEEKDNRVHKFVRPTKNI